MATGTLTLALLLLSTGTVPPDVVPMNSRNFQIPIQIAEGQRGKIKELLLFSSSDQGATWNEAAVAPPDKDAFIFYAPADGLYWFNICVVDAQGRREPPDIFKSTPRQKVLVDTLKPNLRIMAAERQGDDIVVAWEIQEEHPDLATLKLEHRTPDAPSWMWTPASINPAMSGQARFRVATSGPVLIRMQIADDAGNIGDAQAEVKAKAWAVNTPAPTVVPAALQSNATTPTSPATPAATPGGSLPPPPAYATPGAPPPNPARTSAPPPGSPWESSPPAAVPRADPRMMPERSWGASAAPNYQQTGGYGPDPGREHAGPVANTGVSYPLSAPAGSRPPGEALGSLQTTNSTQVTLDYEVTRQGPSGVSKVELYLTQDEGRTWQRYYEDPHPKPPMTVNLPGEGIFGLRLVVTSGAGLARKPPQPGDVPQLRVEVDTTPPAVKLFPPQPDPQRRDVLVLTWNASDRNLAPNPVTLQCAERPSGPWQTIAADLTNSGRYQWQLPPNLPFRVYLRLMVRDAAGNVGVDETPEPVLIDMNEPEGQLKGIIKAVQRP